MQESRGILMEIEFTPIGYIVAPYESREEQLEAEGMAPEGLEATLVIKEEYQEALLGIDQLERIEVIWLLNQVASDHYKDRLTFENPVFFDGRRGIFATRTQYRPNRIGLTEVEVLEVQGNRIKVRGADMLNQSPIIDIKPWISYEK